VDEDSWRIAKDLIALALLQPASERDAFLRDRCPDPTLRAEIGLMLAQYDEGPDFLDVDGVGDETADLTPGDRVGPYEVVERLGSGGMGQVFLATDTRLRRPVALKCLHTPNSFSPATGAQILREARAAGRISHPNVATIYDIVEHDNRAFLVMEYLEGENLIARLKRGPLPADLVIQMGSQLAAGLAAAHAKGIIHRDVKPSNIQITPDGTPKILDFGVARITVDASTTMHTLAAFGHQPGTPAYMSPEQMIGADVDARTDIFSLGIVLFEMATGRRANPPGDRDDPAAAWTRPLPRADAVEPTVTRRLADVIARMVALDPGDRFQSAADVQRALAAVSRPRRSLFWWR
jgi:serine/threonine protein kinase